MIFVLLVTLIFIGIPLWGIVDAAQTPPAIWRVAGQSRAAWIVVQLLLSLVGTAAYALLARPRLRRAAASSH